MGFSNKEIYIGISNSIKHNKKAVVKSLRDSGIDISDKATDVQVVNAVVNNMFDNPFVSKNLSKVAVEKHSNAVSPDVIVAISEGIGGIFDFGSQIISNSNDKKEAERQLALERERARAEMMKNLGKKQTDYLPFMIIGGVLLLGGVVVVLTLKK
jgi:hypothetical protein